ncbi:MULTISPECIES: YjcG family protein [Exiguobacterium]|uniref:Putative phosphoesterase QK289_06115 n=1 Tax=Exiguobacterium antarcticum TaxID=132920 RepID=A0ABT6R0U6_9BACL|nr:MULTISPECIES: YjcG family protein [Exiguobacterium]AFS70991.1 2`-5` RNA ligase superfamily [Exiguobacterium antarcticum B7]MCT4778675.1 YjcG family protein [Exiguobacterium soli]MDI3234575.1 YjcG family protein [Exiguobacterium antarcticum]
MNIGVVLFPSKQIQDFANSYRKRYDSKYALITPHITMRERISVDDAELETIVAALNRVAAQTKPVSLHIQGARSFHPTNNVLFLKVMPTDELEQLHRALHAGDLAHTPKYDFLPHITIGQDLSDVELFDVLERLKMEDIRFQEDVTKMALLYELDNGSWSVYETFRFTSQ